MRLSWACVRCHVRAHAPARNSKSSQKRAALQSSGKTDLSRDKASPRCTLFTSLKHVFPPAAMHCNAKKDQIRSDQFTCLPATPGRLHNHAGHLSHLSLKYTGLSSTGVRSWHRLGTDHTSREFAEMGSMTKQSASLPFSFFSKQCARPCTCLIRWAGSSCVPQLSAETDAMNGTYQD